MKSPSSTYDVVAYPSYTHVQTHPDRLAVVGRLLGLEPAPVTSCRVLELGCGDGSNLVPMAFGLPGSQFVGIDLAARPIAQGQEMISQLGLKNVRLDHRDLAQFDRGGENFDYIIAHGLFSWVPTEVRQQMLVICRECLAPQGIAFVSYNALPGFHVRSMLREMMLFHVRGIDSPPERMRQAQALAELLAAARSTDDEYSRLMKAEAENIRNHEPGHLFHDELAEISDAFYFTQFVELAGRHGLKYLGEADYFEMFDHGLSEAARGALQPLAGNRILREQYLDFLKCRRFRQTLLCHAEAAVANEPDATKVADFFISSRCQNSDAVKDLSPGKIVTYVTPNASRCSTDLPVGKAALEVLAGNEGLPLSFDELAARSAATLTAAGIPFDMREQRGELSGFLLQLHGAGAVDFRTWLPRVVAAVSECPVASPLVRWQASHDYCVTAYNHVSVRIEDEVGPLILSSLDGSLNFAGLVEKVLALLKAKNALAADAGDEAVVREKVAEDLTRNLTRMAQLGLLIA